MSRSKERRAKKGHEWIANGDDRYAVICSGCQQCCRPAVKGLARRVLRLLQEGPQLAVRIKEACGGPFRQVIEDLRTAGYCVRLDVDEMRYHLVRDNKHVEWQQAFERAERLGWRQYDGSVFCPACLDSGRARRMEAEREKLRELFGEGF